MNKGLKISLLVISALALGTAGYFIVRKLRSRKSMRLAPNIKKVLFVGDSSTVANPSYAEYLKQDKGYEITKLAKVGISTNKMLTLLQDELATNKYDLIVILGGYNNNYAYGSSVPGNLSKTETELSAMYDLAHSNGAKVLAITPPASANNKNYNSDRQKFHDGINSWILASDADYKIDLYTMETGSKNSTKPLQGNTGSDGEHLSASMQRMLAKAIEGSIA